jgi:hypothetical protein
MVPSANKNARGNFEKLSAQKLSQEARHDEHDTNIKQSSVDLHRQMDTEDFVFATGEALSSRAVAPASRRRVAEDADEDSAQSGIDGISDETRDEIESHCCRVLADSSGENAHQPTQRHVPLGKTTSQGRDRAGAVGGNASDAISKEDELEFAGGIYVPGMHRKHSSNGRGSRIRGRDSRGVHRQVQKIFQSEQSQSVS